MIPINPVTLISGMNHDIILLVPPIGSSADIIAAANAVVLGSFDGKELALGMFDGTKLELGVLDG